MGLHAIAFAAVLVFRVEPRTRIEDSVIAAAVQEAAAIWNEYGVALQRVDADAPACVVVSIQRERRAPTVWTVESLSLGSIDFDETGAPSRRIHVSLDAIEELLAHGTSEPPYDGSPGVVRQQLLGRAIGRVIAHEFGHYLLRFPAHIRTGLMAPQHTSLELVGADRAPFALTTLLESRLHEAQHGSGGAC